MLPATVLLYNCLYCGRVHVIDRDRVIRQFRFWKKPDLMATDRKSRGLEENGMLMCIYVYALDDFWSTCGKCPVFRLEALCKDILAIFGIWNLASKSRK